MKKAFTLFLAALMIMSIFASCKEPDNVTESEDGVTSELSEENPEVTSELSEADPVETGRNYSKEFDKYSGNIKENLILFENYVLAGIEGSDEDEMAEYENQFLLAFENDVESFLEALVAMRKIDGSYYEQALMKISYSIALASKLNGDNTYFEILEESVALPLSDDAMEMLLAVQANAQEALVH